MPFLLPLLSLQLTTTSFAQQYSIDAYQIAGGGGTSSNAQFAVSGAVGQLGAGMPMSGGSYSLAGGFWSVVSVVQTPGSPVLRLAMTGTNTVVLAWPASATRFVLQQNSGLSDAEWSTVSNAPVLIGHENQVVLPLSAGNRFYRLKYPR